MKIILISENGKRHARVSVNLWLHVLAPVFLLFFIILGLTVQVRPYAYFNPIKSMPAQGGLSEYENPKNDYYKAIFTGDILRIDDSIDTHDETSHKSIQPVKTALTPTARLSLSGVPVKSGIISSRYGYRVDPFNRRSRMHRGVDIVAQPGTSIYTLASGFIVFSGRKGGYGNVVEVQHDKSIMTRYAHLQKVLVKQGEVVKKGDIVAKMGSTGRSTGPHLHLEVLKDGRTVDPELYFDGSLTGY